VADTSIFSRIGRLFAGADEEGPTSDHEQDGEDLQKARGGPVGSAGITTVGGYLVTDERMPTLTGTKRYETYRTMMADVTIIAASIRLFLNLISKSAWQVQPAKFEDGTPEHERAEEIAKLVTSMMDDHETPWSRIVRKQAMFRFLGFALQEWTFKKRPDGAIGMADVSHRPQRTINRWDVTEGGQVLGVWQYNTAFQEVYIPRDRLVYSVDDTLTDDPDGMGLLRNVARAAARLKSFEQLEEVGFETDLRGVPVAYGPWEELDAKVKAGTISDKDRRAYKKPMIDFVTGHIRNRKTGLLLPSETYRAMDDAKSPSTVKKWSAELLQGQDGAFKEMGEAIHRLAQEIARVFGTEHLLLGADGSGSLALGKSKVGTFYLNATSLQYELVETFEADWLGPLADANGWSEEETPTLAIEEIRDQDIDQITKAIVDMANAGASLSPEDAAVAEVFQMLGLTPPDPDLSMALTSAAAGLDPALDPATGQSAVDVPDDAAQTVKIRKSFIRSEKGRKRHG